MLNQYISNLTYLNAQAPSLTKSLYNQSINIFNGQFIKFI